MGRSRRHSNFIARASGWATWFAVVWERPLYAGVLALVIYALIGRHWNSSWHVTPAAYFNYLADAFLHGQLHLRLLPPVNHDLVYYGGQYYLYWSPLPAILLMPFVALFGMQFSDVLYTLGLASLNVVLVALLLRQATRRGVIGLSVEQRGMLVMFFALGTVCLTLAPFGRVWFTSQLLAVGCVTLAYLAALRWRGWPAFAIMGVALGGALLTRSHMALTGAWPLAYLISQSRTLERRGLIRCLMAAGLPVVFAAIGLGLYNAARFGSPLESGLTFQLNENVVFADFETYGAFNLHYLPTNLFYLYLAYPFPITAATWYGGSLFLLSPVFFAAFWGVAKGQPRWSIATLGLTIGLSALPSLLLMGTGWLQFGPRYTLDFIVPLLLLTAMGLKHWPRWLAVVLTGVSIAQYLVGTMYFGALVT